MCKSLFLLFILSLLITSAQAEDMLEVTARDAVATTGEVIDKITCFHENGLFSNVCRVHTVSGKNLLVICNTTMTPGNNKYSCSVDANNSRF